MSLLGKLFARGVDADDSVVIRPGRKFTKQDILRIAERGASEFRNNNLNLLSSYGPLDGEFGLYETLSNFLNTKNPLTEEISDAVADGDEIALLEAFRRAMEFSFVSLLEKGALKRLQLVEQWPTEAMAEYQRMRRSAVPTKPAIAVPAAAPVAPAVYETPVETCAREFRELPSSVWKNKWLVDQRNRPVADLAAAEGRI